MPDGNFPPGRRPLMTVAERDALLHKGDRAMGIGANVPRGIAGAVAQGMTSFWGAARRLPGGINSFVSTVTGRTWFGPQQPLPPQAQDPEQGAVGRAMDYPFGWNLQITPRLEDGGVSFGTLRAMAEGCDVVRGAIQVRKDEVEGFDWKFVPSDPDAEEGTVMAQIKAATAFWERPDGELDWTSWMRKGLDDVLVCDALAIWPEKTRGGQVAALQLLDGGSIKRVINEYGRTPLAPDPAYQQILHGFPAVDYTRDELFYTMRDPRTYRLYGYSPVEQILTTINLALRRTAWQLDYYTQGTVPDMVISLPKEWSGDQIAQFQAYMDGLLTGNTAERRKVRFVPAADKIVETKSAILKDEFDDYLIRLVCFVFRVSPQALMKQMNRAQAQQAADTVKEQGLLPILRWIERLVTRLTNDVLGIQGVKFSYNLEDRIDQLKQAQTDQIYMQEKVKTPDEVRESLGMAPLSPADREKAFPVAPELGAPGAPKGAAGAKPDAPETGDPNEVARMMKAMADASSPERIALLLRENGEIVIKAVREAVKGQPPNVVELKPRVSVRVGDVNLNQERAAP